MKVDFTTRLDADLRRRLRIFAAVSEQTIEDIVGSALSSYLPSAAETVPGPAALEVAAADQPVLPGGLR